LPGKRNYRRAAAMAGSARDRLRYLTTSALRRAAVSTHVRVLFAFHSLATNYGSDREVGIDGRFGPNYFRFRSQEIVWSKTGRLYLLREDLRSWSEVSGARRLLSVFSVHTARHQSSAIWTVARLTAVC